MAGWCCTRPLWSQQRVRRRKTSAPAAMASRPGRHAAAEFDIAVRTGCSPVEDRPSKGPGISKSLSSCFSDGRRSGLVHIFALALVRVELLLDSGLCFRRPTERLVCWELHIAELADSQHWNVVRPPDDPKFSLCHASSLRRSFRRSMPMNFNLHHYPGSR